MKHKYLGCDDAAEIAEDPGIPTEAQGALGVDLILQEIFTYLSMEALDNCKLVNRTWRILAQAELQRNSYVFGAAEWKKAFNMEITDIPPLTFRSRFMVLIPQGLSLELLQTRSRNPLQGPRANMVIGSVGEVRRDKIKNSYWVGLSRHIKENRISLELHRASGPVPKSDLFDATVAQIAYHVATGKVLYSSSIQSDITGKPHHLEAEMVVSELRVWSVLYYQHLARETGELYKQVIKGLLYQ